MADTPPPSEDIIIDLDVNQISRANGRGTATATLSSVLRGKNWLGSLPGAPKNDDSNGLIFITKPDMNLSYDNIGTNRELAPLLTQDSNTLPYAVKMSLDPWGAINRDYSSPLVDRMSAFIHLLDNTLTSCDGWPDYVLNEYISQPGKRGQQLILSRGIIDKYGKVDLSVGHQNIKGDPVNLIYNAMIQYRTKIMKGTMAMYPRNVAANRADYQSRFYRFVFDVTRRFVTQFTCNSVCFPRAAPLGAVMNYNINKPINEGYDEISNSWVGVGCWHNDPLVLREFNRAVVKFNPMMADSRRSGVYTLVPHQYQKYFKFYGYPRIDTTTLEFQIWVDNGIYRTILESVGIDPNEPVEEGEMFWN